MEINTTLVNLGYPFLAYHKFDGIDPSFYSVMFKRPPTFDSFKMT